MEGVAAPGGLVLEMTVVLDAPRASVFRALSEAAVLPQWWGPAGFTTPEVELDLELGGRYRLGMQPPDGGLFHLSGEYVEIDPPRRLGYTFRWDEPAPDDQDTVVALALDVRDAGTRLTVSHGEFATEERLALHRDGWTDSLERLRRLLESQS